MTTTVLPIADIGPGPKVRHEAIDLDHVATLVPVLASLPPITVRRVNDRHLLVDGAHRLAAHRRSGAKTITVVVVEASDAEALELATVANRGHGKPFTMSELQSIARRMVESTDWSDVRIGQACGLSDKTVAGLRPKCATSETPRLHTGTDGRSRPATKAFAETNRERIREAIAAEPEASSREVARKVGVSNRTVSTVRAEASEPTRLTVVPTPAPDAPKRVDEVLTLAPVPGRWSRAAGFDQSNAGRELARFLDRRLLRDNEDVAVLAEACPAEWRNAVAMVARSVARDWSLLAEHLSGPAAMKGVR